MDLMRLFKRGASWIEANDDEATTRKDINTVAMALDTLLGDRRGGLDLASLLISSNKNGLGSLVDSWFSNGENKNVSTQEIVSILGKDKILAFSSRLGISNESAVRALVETVPKIVDIATKGEETIVDEMLSQGDDALTMLGKILR